MEVILVILLLIAPFFLFEIVATKISKFFLEKALTRLPEDFVHSIVFKSGSPTVIFDNVNRRIAFASRRKIEIVNFDDIKSWQHTWTYISKTRSVGFFSSSSSSQIDHKVKVLSSGMIKPSIEVSFLLKQGAEELADTFALHLG
ncbi:hypothetical protein ACOI1H_16280 [Loktanella sp. DJP18]|uniref:hypothetical protein n=1 Tax=Loktanella sp. DJP18 TaxID=3409788 RepID=UPI003BB75A30